MRLVGQEWDALIAIVATVSFWIVVGLSGRELESAAGPVLAAITLGGTFAGAAFVAGRWVSDRLSKEEYGELILAIDPQELRIQRPYQIVTYSGLVTAGFGIAVAVSLNEFPRSVSVLLFGLLFGLSSYCILGMVSLVRITARHQRRVAFLRATKAHGARERRIARLQKGHVRDDSDSRSRES